MNIGLIYIGVAGFISSISYLYFQNIIFWYFFVATWGVFFGYSVTK